MHMYNSARGFLAQEFSDSPGIVEMIVGVLAGFCDLPIYFQVGAKNHTQVSHWRHRCDPILTHTNECYVYAFELLFTSVLQSRIFNGSDWGCLIRGRNGSEWQVNLMVIGIVLGFWEVLFYDLEQVGNIDDEQHRAKAGPCGTPMVNSFFSGKVPLIFTAELFGKDSDVNHCKAIPPTPKPKPKVSNKIPWSTVSNAALRSSMTGRVTFWSFIFSKTSDCAFRSDVSVVWNGL